MVSNQTPETKQNLSLLNQLLHGMNIGNQSLKSYINTIKDENLRHQLEGMEKEYQLLTQELSSHIRDLGGKPDDDTGLSGTMAHLSTLVSNAMADTPLDTINDISEGLNMGIDSLEKALPELKGNSANLIKKDLSAARGMFQQLEVIKRQYLH